MTRSLTRLNEPANVRFELAGAATLEILETSCFLSSEAWRHVSCRTKALEFMGLGKEASDAEIVNFIEKHPSFGLQGFYCQGAAVICGECGGIIGPGYRACPSCGVTLDEPIGILAKPEWETRVTLTSLDVIIATTLLINNLLGQNIHKTIKLLVLRNLINQSPLATWNARVNEIRNTIVDRWPEGHKPETTSWQYKFIRVSAIFWVVAWPMLKKYFTLEEVDEIFNTRLVRAVGISAPKWYDAGADPDVYGKLMRLIIDADGLDKEAAIKGLSPNDIQSAENVAASGNAKVMVLHPPELIVRGNIVRSQSGSALLAVAVTEDEVQILESQYGLSELDYSELISQLEGDDSDS